MKTQYKRILYYLNADAKSDIETNIEAVNIYNKCVLELTLNLPELIKTGTQGEAIYLNTFRLPYPTMYTTNRMIIVPVQSKNLLVVFALTDDSSKIFSGLFNPDGIYNQNTIFIYTPLFDFSKPKSYTMLANIIKTSKELRSIFIHEYRHFIDFIIATNKNPNAEPYRSYKTFKEDLHPNIKNKNFTRSFAKYMNQSIEVNARYSEWLVRILEDLKSLPMVRKYGMVVAFPNFMDFWTYFWHSDFTPIDLKDFITSKNTKYLQKRLYKFYAYLKTQNLNLQNNSKVVKDYLKQENTNG